MVKAVRESLPAEDSVYGFLGSFDVISLPDDISTVKPVIKALPWIQKTISENRDYLCLPSYGLDVGMDEIAIHQLSQIQETTLGCITDTGYHPSCSYEVNGGLVKLISPRFTQTEETFFRDFACYYISPSYVDLVKRMQEAALEDFGNYRSISSHELDVGPVDPVTDTFTWIQETISKNIRDCPSILSHELDIGLVEPLTNAFAWIEGGIDAIEKIVSVFHWGYKQGSAIVAAKAIVSENLVLFLIDPDDAVLSKLLAAIDIGGDLATKSIDNCFDVKIKARGEPTPICFEVIA